MSAKRPDSCLGTTYGARSKSTKGPSGSVALTDAPPLESLPPIPRFAAMMLDRHDPDHVGTLKVDEREAKATEVDAASGIRARAPQGRECRNEPDRVFDIVKERGSEAWRFGFVVIERGQKLIAGRGRELDAQLCVQPAACFGEDLFGRSRIHRAGLELGHAPPDLGVPRSLYLRISR